MPRDLYCLNCEAHFACHIKGQERFYEAWVPIRQVQEDTGLQHIREIFGLNQASVCAIKNDKNFGLCKDCFKYLQTIKRCENEINEAKDDFLKQNKEGSFLYKRRNLKGHPQQDKVAHDRTAEQAQIPKVIFLTPINTQKDENGEFVQKECVCSDLVKRRGKGGNFWKAVRSMALSRYTAGIKTLVNSSERARKEFHALAQNLIRSEIKLYLMSYKFCTKRQTIEQLKNFSWKDFYVKIREKLPFTYLVLEAILASVGDRKKLQIEKNGTVGGLVPMLGVILSSMLRQRHKHVKLIPSIISMQLCEDKSFDKAYTMLKDLGLAISEKGAEKLKATIKSSANPNLSGEGRAKGVPEWKIYPLSKVYTQNQGSGETLGEDELENERREESEDENKSDEEAVSGREEEAKSGSEEEAESGSEEEAESGSEEEAESGSEEEAESGSEEEAESGSEEEAESGSEEAESGSEEEVENGSEEEAESGSEEEVENGSEEKDESGSEEKAVNASEEEDENSKDINASEDEADNDSEEEAENGSKSDTGRDEEAEERSPENTVSSSSTQPVSRTSENSTANTSGRLNTESHVTTGSHVTAAWTESVLLDIDKDISVSDMSSAFMSLDDFGDTTCTESPVVSGSLELSENEVLPVIPLTNHEYSVSQKEKETGDCSMQNSHQSQPVDSAEDNMDIDEIGDIPGHSESIQSSVNSGMRNKNKRKCPGNTDFQGEAKKQKVVHSGESGATGVELGERNHGVAQANASIKDKYSDISQGSADERQVALRNESETTDKAENEGADCSKDDSAAVLTGHVNTDKTSENSMPGVRKSVRKRQPNVRGMEIDDKVSRLRKLRKKKLTQPVDRPIETDISELNHNNVVTMYPSHKPNNSSTLFRDEEHKVKTSLEYYKSHGFKFVLSRMKLLVCDVVRSCGKTAQYRNFDLEKGPSRKWFKTFVRRKKIHGMSINWRYKIQTTEQKVEAYFLLLRSMIKDLGLEDRPEQIYNCGEFSLGDIAKVKLTDDGEDSSVDSSVGGQSTVQLAVSAAGRVMFPFFVVQNATTRSNLSETSEDTIVQGCLLESSDTGCMNEDLFCKWFHKVFLTSRTNSKGPRILLMNNSSSFLCPEVIRSAILKRVHIIYTPPEVSHNLLPLDHSIFGLLKHHMKKSVSAGIIDSKEVVVSVKHALSQLLYSDISQAFMATCVFSYQAEEANGDILSSRPALVELESMRVRKPSKRSAPTYPRITAVSSGHSVLMTNYVSQNVVPGAVDQSLLPKNPVCTVSKNVVPSAVGRSQLPKNPVCTVSQNAVPSAVGQSKLRNINLVDTVSQNAVPSAVDQSKQRKNRVGTVSQNLAPSAVSQSQLQKNPVDTVSEKTVRSALDQSQLLKNLVCTVSQNEVPSAVGLSLLRKNAVGVVSQNVVHGAVSQSQLQKNPVGTVSQKTVRSALDQSQLLKNRVCTVSQNEVPSAVGLSLLRKNAFGVVSQNVVHGAVSQSQLQKNPVGTVSQNAVPSAVGQSQLRKNAVGTVSQNEVHSAVSQSQLQKNPVGTVSQNAVPSAVGQSQLRKNAVGTVSQNEVHSAVSQSQLQKNPVGTVSQNAVPSAVGQSQLRKNAVGTVSQNEVHSAVSQSQLQKNPVGTVSQRAVHSALDQSQLLKNRVCTVSQNVVPSAVGLSLLPKNPVGTVSQNVVHSAVSQSQLLKNLACTVSQNAVPSALDQSQLRKNSVCTALQNLGHAKTVPLLQTKKSKPKKAKRSSMVENQQKLLVTANPVTPLIATVANCSKDFQPVLFQPVPFQPNQQKQHHIYTVAKQIGHGNNVPVRQYAQKEANSSPVVFTQQKKDQQKRMYPVQAAQQGLGIAETAIAKLNQALGSIKMVQPINPNAAHQNNQDNFQILMKSSITNVSPIVALKVQDSSGSRLVMLPKLDTKIKDERHSPGLLTTEQGAAANPTKEQQASPVALFRNSANKQ